MRRSIVVLLVLSLAAGSLGASAAAGKKKKKKKPKRIERVIEHEYSFGSPGIPGLVGACLASQTEGSGCINIPTTLDEKFVTVDVTDSSGLTPAGILAQDTDTDNTGYEIFATFCGRTEEPVPITPGLELRVSVYVAPSASCAGAATSGSFTATLSNRR